MNQFGYLGIALLIAIENIFPPIPSEIILTFGGFMSTYTDMNVFLIILFATIGSVAGAVVLYFLGRLLKKERLERIFDGKLGKILHLKKEDVTKADAWFAKHGKKTVFLCRFIPIVRSLISIPAGMSKMKLTIFLPLTLAGTIIWNSVLIFMGRFVGSAWESVAHYFDTFSTIVLIAILFIMAVIAFIFIKKRFLDKQPDAASSDNSKENAKPCEGSTDGKATDIKTADASKKSDKDVDKADASKKSDKDN